MASMARLIRLPPRRPVKPVSLVLDLHGIGLARLLAVIARSDEGETLVARLIDDDHIRAMLLLHGLHPRT